MSLQKSHNGLRVALTIFREPSDGSTFNSTPYWLPVYDSENRRLYVVYADSVTGYKTQHIHKGGIGLIAFESPDLVKDMGGTKTTMTFNWKWDTECTRPYITIPNK